MVVSPMLLRGYRGRRRDCANTCPKEGRSGLCHPRGHARKPFDGPAVEQKRQGECFGPSWRTT
jgi:hypothetical protein